MVGEVSKLNEEELTCWLVERSLLVVVDIGVVRWILFQLFLLSQRFFAFLLIVCLLLALFFWMASSLETLAQSRTLPCPWLLWRLWYFVVWVPKIN